MKNKKNAMSVLSLVIVMLALLAFPCSAKTLEESFYSRVYYNYGGVTTSGQYEQKCCQAATYGYSGRHYVRAQIFYRGSSNTMADTGRVISMGDVSTTAVTSWRLIATGDFDYVYFGTAKAWYGTDC